VLASPRVQRVAGFVDGPILTGMALRRADVADAAVPVLMVVPMHEASRPTASLVEIGEALDGNSGRYLAVRNRLSTKALSSLTRGREYDGFTPSQYSIANTVVAFSVAPLSPCSTGLSGLRVDALSQRRALDEVRCMIGVVRVVDFEADDLAAEHVQDQVQVVPVRAEVTIVPRPLANLYDATTALSGACGPDAGLYAGHALQGCNVATIFVLVTSTAGEGVMMLLTPV
jgi:hypothetical protein